MKTEECYYLGKLGKAHGIKGGITAWLDVDDQAYYLSSTELYILQNNTLVQHKVNAIKPAPGGRMYLELDAITNRTDAENLVGAKLYLPLDKLPPLQEGQFYYHDVVGYSLHDTKDGHLGEVTGVIDGVAQDLLTVGGKNGEILIPIVEKFILSLDHEQKTIHTNLPDGLVNIND